MDSEEISNLLLEVNEDDDVSFLEDDVEDDRESDECEVSDHNTSSEQSVDSSSDSEDESLANVRRRARCDKRVMLGKDMTSKWFQEPPPPNVRTRQHNIVSERPGVKPYAASADSPHECFKLFIDDNIIDIIVKNTNIYIQKHRSNFSRERDAQDTNKMEISALIGTLIVAGLLKSSRVNVQDMWDTNGLGIERLIATMSYNRFAFLLRCLRFDDINDRHVRRKEDKLAAIRQIFDIFVGNCKRSFTPSEYLTIDEKLEAFRGRCSFRQYIPNKPAKYGIKIFAVVDATNFYACNLEVYVGKQEEGKFKVSNKPHDLVLRMVSPYSGSGRNITMDNWFTSVALAESLLIDNKITMTGTIRKNKRELPPEFINTRKREVKSSIFGFQSNKTIVSYVPKKGKNVILLSTLHSDKKIDGNTAEKMKPEIITFYNKTKGGVDTLDQMCNTYSVSRNSRRWPLTLFFALINIAGINAQVIFLNNTSNKMKRRAFLKNLAWELTIDLIQYRATVVTLPREVRELAKRIGNVYETPSFAPSGKKQGGRCAKCPRSKDRKTRFICQICKIYLCLDHAQTVCEECAINITEVASESE